MKEEMEQLNAHAQAITQIMSVISDIADQTNLLALNAAIEAARAGDAGRGFAVVADEVRKLAEKTMSSTQDVGNAISVIQESTAKSMEAMDNAVSRISDATELANQSGAALREIVSTADDTFDRIQAIATASEEQSAASEEINRSIITVNDMSRQTASSMTEAAKAVLIWPRRRSPLPADPGNEKSITDSGHPTAGNRKRCAPSGSTPFSAWPRRAQAVNKRSSCVLRLISYPSLRTMRKE